MRFIHTAPVENYTVNYSVGTEKVSSSTTMNFFDQEGVLYNTGTKRYAMRTNTEYRPNERIKLGLNLAPAYQIDHKTRGGLLALNGNRQVVAGADLSSPLISPYKSPGVWNLSTASYGMYALPNYLQQEKIMDTDQTNSSFSAMPTQTWRSSMDYMPGPLSTAIYLARITTPIMAPSSVISVRSLPVRLPPPRR